MIHSHLTSVKKTSSAVRTRKRTKYRAVSRVSTVIASSVISMEQIQTVPIMKAATTVSPIRIVFTVVFVYAICSYKASPLQKEPVLVSSR